MRSFITKLSTFFFGPSFSLEEYEILRAKYDLLVKDFGDAARDRHVKTIVDLKAQVRTLEDKIEAWTEVGETAHCLLEYFELNGVAAEPYDDVMLDAVKQALEKVPFPIDE